MQYAPYIRPVPGADTAVLCVHGIVGTPAQFRDLLPLIPENWSIYNILLDGHGKQVQDFGKTSMKKWKAQVCRQLDEILESHKQVLILAHSMGTLFAIQEAIRRPDRVKALFLLAVPLTPHLPPSTAFYSTLAALGWYKPGQRAETFVRASGVHLSPNLFRYIAWIPRFLELLALVREVRRILPQLNTPTRSYQSYTDELVGRGAIRQLAKYPVIQNTVLQGSGHFFYDENDTRLLQSDFAEVIASIQ